VAASSGLVVDGVRLTYETRRGPLTALDGLTFSTAAGEFVAVLGPSGCGKSTLLRLISGLLPPSAGTIHLAGAKVEKPRPDVGMVFQQPTLLPWQTVRANVMMPVRALGLDVARYRPVADQLLQLVGLEKFADAYPGELSGGMQQRVAVARSLVHDPALLLMDEPFAALDAMTRESMMVELQRIWMGTGKSVLFITHSIPEAVFLSDRIVVMSPRPGRVIAIVAVELARPRTLHSMADQTFVSLADRLRDMFREPPVERP
jgi:NitT/TauT family transport system ATP-binding protein